MNKDDYKDIIDTPNISDEYNIDHSNKYNKSKRYRFRYDTTSKLEDYKIEDNFDKIGYYLLKNS